MLHLKLSHPRRPLLKIKIPTGTKKSDDPIVAFTMSCHMLGLLFFPGRKSNAQGVAISRPVAKSAPPSLLCGLREDGRRHISTELLFRETVKSFIAYPVKLTLGLGGRQRL